MPKIIIFFLLFVCALKRAGHSMMAWWWCWWWWSLQHLLKVPATSTHSRMKTLMPLVDRSVDDVLIKMSPLLHQPFLQMIDVTNSCLADMVLQHWPDLVVNWDPGCLEARLLVRWRPVFHSIASQLCHTPCELVRYLAGRWRNRRTCVWLQEADVMTAACHNNRHCWSSRLARWRWGRFSPTTIRQQTPSLTSWKLIWYRAVLLQALASSLCRLVHKVCHFAHSLAQTQ